MILVTGGAGFIGANFVLDWLAQADEPVVNLDKLTYAGNLETCASLEGDPRHVFVQGDIGDRALVDQLLAEHKPRAIVQLRGRVARGPLDPRPRRLRADQCGRHLPPARVGARLLAKLPARARRRPSASCTSRPTRSTARLGATDPAFTETPSLRAQQPLLGQQGRQRPPGARLAPHLRAAGADHQLLEQLRALSFPREADPADDRQRARGQAAAGVWRRPAGARLALRERPLQRHPPRARSAARLGETYNVGGWNEKPNIEIVQTICALLDELRPRRRRRPTPADHLRDRPPRPRPPLRDRRRARSSASWAGSRPRPSRPASARRCAGTWTMPNGCAEVQSGAYREWVEKQYAGRAHHTAGPGGARMKILLLGKNGQVGWELQRSLGAGRTGRARLAAGRRAERRPRRSPMRSRPRCGPCART